jgi:hypothetical protein
VLAFVNVARTKTSPTKFHIGSFFEAYPSHILLPLTAPSALTSLPLHWEHKNIIFMYFERGFFLCIQCKVSPGWWYKTFVDENTKSLWKCVSTPRWTGHEHTNIFSLLCSIWTCSLIIFFNYTDLFFFADGHNHLLPKIKGQTELLVEVNIVILMFPFHLYAFLITPQYHLYALIIMHLYHIYAFIITSHNFSNFYEPLIWLVKYNDLLLKSVIGPRYQLKPNFAIIICSCIMLSSILQVCLRCRWIT